MQKSFLKTDENELSDDVLKAVNRDTKSSIGTRLHGVLIQSDIELRS